jgi:DNA ligase-1
MLAERKLPDTSSLAYPIYASPKLDGCRALVVDGQLRSRALKPFPNKFVSTRFSQSALNGLDGELILGDPTDPDVFRKTSEVLRRKEGEPDVKFYCFDLWDSNLQYKDRIFDMRESIQKWGGHVVLVDSEPVYNEVQLLETEAKCLDDGYEGLILRSPGGMYKFGRATMKEGTMMKLKRFVDEEAEVVGVYEEMHNDNEAQTNELGRTFRSSHQENKVGKKTTGGFLLRRKDGVLFKCGTGLTDKEAALWWKRRRATAYEVKLETETLVYWALKKKVVVKFKHFAHGAKDKPRHPVYLGARDEWDIS